MCGALTGRDEWVNVNALCAEELLFQAKIFHDLLAFKGHGVEPKGIDPCQGWWSDGINVNLGQQLSAVDGIPTWVDVRWLYLSGRLSNSPL